MSKWSTEKIGKIADLCLGKMLDKNKNKGDYQPYLANLNVRWGAFDLTNLQQMRFEAKEEERYGLKYGDIVVCEGGEPGRCAIWKEQLPRMKFQKALHRIRTHSDLDPFFLYYWLSDAGKSGKLGQLYTGATIKHLTGINLANIEVNYPEHKTQKKISSALSNYDDLIENNNRRIAILEEMAQRLYREWFVHFRYPGYERIPTVESKFGMIPEGWSIVCLSDIADNVKKTVKKSDRTQYKYYLPIDCLPRKSLCLKEAKSIDKAESSLIEFMKNDIVMGAMRAYFHKVIYAPFSGITRSTCFVIRAKDAEHNAFVLLTVFQENAIEHASTTSVGSTMPYAVWDSFSQYRIPLPPKPLVDKFCQLVNPMLSKISALTFQNWNLCKSRDLLLPRLISGDIDVSNIDIPVEDVSQ